MPSRHLLLVFLVALLARLAYLGTVYSGDASLLTGDSYAYIGMARDLLAQGLAAPSLSERMPLYPACLALFRIVAGDGWLLVATVAQLVLDGLTCVLIARLGEHIRTGLGFPAGILAALNLNLIVHGAIILTDGPFLLAWVALLLAAVRLMRDPRPARAATVGALLGAGILVRSAAMYAPPLLALAALAPAAGWGRRLRNVGIAMAACAALVVPWLVHNGLTYGHYRLVSQGGVHLAYWVVPLVREYGAGIPSETTKALLRERIAQRLATDGTSGSDIAIDRFREAEAMSAIANEALAETGPLILAKAWAVGSIINLAASPILSMPPVTTLERPSFFATPGDSAATKIANYLLNSSNVTFLIVLAAALSLSAIGLMAAAAGAWLAVRRWPMGATAILALSALYVFAITGPITGVKYRLPVEPVLILLQAEAIMAAIGWWRRKE